MRLVVTMDGPHHRVADAFVVVGLAPPPRLLVAEPAVCGPGPPPTPIVDLAVVQPQRDTHDKGFTILASTVAGQDADVNQGLLRQQVRGGRHAITMVARRGAVHFSVPGGLASRTLLLVV